MASQSFTKDERYILCLYEEALRLGNGDAYFPLNRYAVGEVAGLQRRAVDAICALLIRANFVKKESEVEIYLTENGIRLVQRLLE